MVTTATGLLFTTSPARAEAPSFDLSWTAPGGCPSRERIVDATRARLGESRSEAPPELLVHGTVVRERTGFVVTLALKDVAGTALGEREVRVEGASCKAVEEPAALVLAMMIAARPRPEPTAPVEGPGAAAPPEPAPAPPPKPPTRPPTPTPPEQKRVLVPRLSIGGGAIASIGVLPDVSMGVDLHAMYSPGSILWFGLEASFELGGSVRAGSGEVGFQFLHGGALAGLRVLDLPNIELIVTGAARAGVIRLLPEGYAVIQNESRTAALVGPGAIGRAKLAPHLFAEIFPELDVVLIRDHFQIRDGEQKLSIHRPGLFSVRLSLGLAYEFR